MRSKVMANGEIELHGLFGSGAFRHELRLVDAHKTLPFERCSLHASGAIDGERPGDS